MKLSWCRGGRPFKLPELPVISAAAGRGAPRAEPDLARRSAEELPASKEHPSSLFCSIHGPWPLARYQHKTANATLWLAVSRVPSRTDTSSHHHDTAFAEPGNQAQLGPARRRAILIAHIAGPIAQSFSVLSERALTREAAATGERNMTSVLACDVFGDYYTANRAEPELTQSSAQSWVDRNVRSIHGKDDISKVRRRIRDAQVAAATSRADRCGKQCARNAESGLMRWSRQIALRIAETNGAVALNDLNDKKLPRAGSHPSGLLCAEGGSSGFAALPATFPDSDCGSRDGGDSTKFDHLFQRRLNVPSLGCTPDFVTSVRIRTTVFGMRRITYGGYVPRDTKARQRRQRRADLACSCSHRGIRDHKPRSGTDGIRDVQQSAVFNAVPAATRDFAVEDDASQHLHRMCRLRQLRITLERRLHRAPNEPLLNVADRDIGERATQLPCNRALLPFAKQALGASHATPRARGRAHSRNRDPNDRRQPTERPFATARIAVSVGGADACVYAASMILESVALPEGSNPVRQKSSNAEEADLFLPPSIRSSHQAEEQRRVAKHHRRALKRCLGHSRCFL